MYLEFFKLKELPFRLTPDSEFLYMSGAHSRAKAYMDYTVWNREGFVVITGEIGCGKTTLIQKLLSELDENVLVAKVFQTQLDEVEFLQAVLVEFGLNPFNAKKVELIDMLNTFLVDNFLQLKQLVLTSASRCWKKFACCRGWKRARRRCYTLFSWGNLP
jgi:general secretion pathway protein A